MNTIIILSLILAGVGLSSFLWIKGLYKKNKSLKFKLDFAEKEIEQKRKNEEAYKKKIDIIRKERDIAIEKNKKIDSASGSDLADIINGM
jgi:hypothetical protein